MIIEPLDLQTLAIAFKLSPDAPLVRWIVESYKIQYETAVRESGTDVEATNKKILALNLKSTELLKKC